MYYFKIKWDLQEIEIKVQNAFKCIKGRITTKK